VTAVDASLASTDSKRSAPPALKSVEAKVRAGLPTHAVDCFNCTDKSCETCHLWGADKCKSCHAGFTLTGNHQCKSNCRDGEYKPDPANTLECLACPVGCSECSSLTLCTVCYPGWNLTGGICCLSSQYGQNGVCSPCHSRCKECLYGGQS
jgi:hypothetical protein